MLNLCLLIKKKQRKFSRIFKLLRMLLTFFFFSFTGVAIVTLISVPENDREFMSVPDLRDFLFGSNASHHKKCSNSCYLEGESFTLCVMHEDDLLHPLLSHVRSFEGYLQVVTRTASNHLVVHDDEHNIFVPSLRVYFFHCQFPCDPSMQFYFLDI